MFCIKLRHVLTKLSNEYKGNMSNPNDDTIADEPIICVLDTTSEVTILYELDKPDVTLEEFIHSRTKINQKTGRIQYYITPREFVRISNEELMREKKRRVRQEDPQLYKLFYGNK